ncbi:APC family permease [Variovorax sp. dw_954]|uniref:APC family permease n=1 Tax=Variovorax sp. dw_954 TaxID=2720078 RepID=UPI001BD477CE|nr:APC family permease [Variovorax sp. dw_954]
MSQAHGKLRPVLRFSDLLIYGMTYMVPVAPWVIFGFLHVTSGGTPALAYLLGMGCMVFTAASYATMVERVPRAGSVYAYAREALGPFAGFMAGWLMLLDYILFPALTCVFAAIGLNSQIPAIPREAWVVGLVLVTLAVNWFGIGVSARISAVLFWVSVAAVGAFVIAAVIALNGGKGAGHVGMQSLWPSHIVWQSLLPGVALGVMSYLGFDGISTLSEEVRPEHRHLIGRAIMLSLLLTGVLFVVQASLLSDLMVGFDIRDPASLAYDVANATLGPTLGAVMTWTVVVAAIVAMVPICAGVARLMYAMGLDGQLPRVLGRVHAKHGTPHVAMLLTSVIALVVALVGVDHADELSTMINFGALGGFLLLHLSVLRFFGKREKSVRFVRHRLVPCIGLLVSVGLMLSLSPLALEVGAGWLVAGLLLWAVALRGRPASDGLPVDEVMDSRVGV